MAFFINDKLGLAYETTEGGAAKWNFEDKDFTDLMSPDESEKSCFPRRRVTEDVAFAFMRSKSSSEGASSPRE